MRTSAVVASGTAIMVVGGRLVTKAMEETAKALGVAPVHPMEAQRTLTVDASPEELDRAWRDPGRLSTMLGEAAEVTPIDDGATRWTLPGPMGRHITWDAELSGDQPGQLLRWTPRPGARVPVEVEVRFRPAHNSDDTAVSLRVAVRPPGGAVSEAALAPLGVSVGGLVVKTLYRCKALLETGEVPTLAHNPSARPGAGDRI